MTAKAENNLLKSLFLIAGILLSVAQMLTDSLNQLNLPEPSRIKIGAMLMLTVIVLDGIKRYFDPKTQTKTIWVTVALFVVFILGAIGQKMELLSQLGVGDEVQSFIRLAFSIIILTITTSLKQINSGHTS